MDPLDDLLMCHDLVFLNQDDCNVEGYHVAWVFRWLSNAQDFFVDSSGLRRTGEMMEKYGGNKRMQRSSNNLVIGLRLVTEPNR